MNQTHVAGLVDRFVESYQPQPQALATIRKYAAWQASRQGNEFAPHTGDDVDIRTYLLAQQIAGASRKAIKHDIAALKQFYDWVKADGPAKIAQAYAIDKRWNGIDLCAPDSDVFIEKADAAPDSAVRAAPRAGLGNTPEPWLSKR